jgi:leader peptidase (prepilin peptidase)/N-methyltransferase
MDRRKGAGGCYEKSAQGSDERGSRIMAKIFIFTIGAIIGSFLNVCIYRLPRKESIVNPPSHCPNCKRQILWHDNIPVLSYIILKGRCRFCKSKINFRYFLVELITASLILLFFLNFGLTAKFFSYGILVSALIVATFVDFEIQEIPNEVTLGGLVVGLGLGLAFPSLFGEISRRSSFLNSALGALAGAASIYLMGFFGELVFKKEAMGGGDVKLMAMIGAFLGWKFIMLTFFIAPLFGSIVGIVLKIKEGRQTIPYGPYLSLAALVSIFWGERILGLLFYGL